MAGVVVGGGGGDRDGPLMARQGRLTRSRRPSRGRAGVAEGMAAEIDQPTSREEG